MVWALRFWLGAACVRIVCEVMDRAQPWMDGQPSGSGETPLIDEAAMRDWCDDLDPADVFDLLSRVPGECARCLADIEAALQEGSLPAAKRAAHRLNGMASNLGAARLSQMARRMELGCTSVDDVREQLPGLSHVMHETTAETRARAAALAAY